VLSQKLEEFAPHVVAFNGKLTYEQFSQRKCKYGIQKESLYGARVYVLPSTSGANAQGRSEKLRHFRKLAQLIARNRKRAGRAETLTQEYHEPNAPSSSINAVLLEGKQDGIATLVMKPSRPDERAQ